jgi:two-component system chemotaxis response regulator CheB
MIRVLVAEDSSTARALLLEILCSDPDIEVVGEAHDGREAVELTHALRPDLVTMDIQMPSMDGFEATKEIMIASPTPIVIVSGLVQMTEAEAVARALTAGALTVLRKPEGPAAAAFDKVSRALIATVKAMSQVKVVRHRHEANRLTSPRTLPRAATGRVVAVATSTGGPAALHSFLTALPGDFPAPILIVQHITPGFVGGLVRSLDAACKIRVKLAEHGERMQRATAYVAPDDFHLGASANLTIMLSPEPPVGGFRPAGTVLFESVARAYGSATVAVILTGMGNDGVAGLRSVRRFGGRIIAQDEDTSVVFGMPEAAIVEGLADQVVALEAIPARVAELICGG